jgi:ubiquinone/menaquinone biosynthesis C-methylase UbiE
MELQPLLERTSEYKKHEWDAKAYDNSNRIETEAFISLLLKYKIITKDRTILDVGCGTGTIAAHLTKKAEHIDAFDASNNMIDYAENKYCLIPNLYFKQCFAEDFTTIKRYQLAIAPFCIHWFKDYKKAFHNIHTSLKKNGEFFATVSTSNNPKSSNIIAAETIIAKYLGFLSLFNINLLGRNLPSIETLQTMLNETNFEIMDIKEEAFSGHISKHELQEGLWVLISESPLLDWMPDKLVKTFFEWYVEEHLSYVPKIDANTFIYTIFTTVIHARKK